MNERLRAAADLGMDHAEAQDNGKQIPRIFSGRQVADALGIADELSGLDYR